MKITDFINGPVEYDPYGGQYLWIKNSPLLCVHGWDRIENLFTERRKSTAFQDKVGQFIDQSEASAFQDEVCQFIADAINEKIQRLKDQDAISKRDFQ